LGYCYDQDAIENDQEQAYFLVGKKGRRCRIYSKFKHNPTYLSSVSVDLSITTIDTDAKM
jgi:glycerol-3-phosphate dehydrogenase (NAD(P)+)